MNRTNLTLGVVALVALEACVDPAVPGVGEDEAGSTGTGETVADPDDDGDDDASGDAAPNDDGSDETTDATSGEPLGECPEGIAMPLLSGKAGVHLKVNGAGPFAFIVDTGAPTTVIDPAILAEIGNAPFVVDVAGQTLPSTTSFDQYPISQAFPDAVGVLGMDLLADYAITFDYPGGRFWLGDDDDADLRACDHVHGNPVFSGLQAYGGYLWTKGAMEGYGGWMLLDTGATLGAVVDTAFEVLTARAARPTLQGFYTEAIIGTFWADLAALGEISVAGRSVEAPLVRTIPEFQLPPPPDETAPMLGLLPTPFLRHFMVTVDVGGGSLRLDRALDDPGIEPPLYFPLGIGIQLSTEPPVLVGQVMPGSAAEAEGVQIGDRIVSVSGQAFDTLPATTRPWALVGFSEGSTSVVTLERNRESFNVALEARNLLLPPS